MTRRTDLLDELAALRVDTADRRAPRIDTVRNRIAAAVSLLGTVAEELDDLHVLAYDRVVARREAVVAGGSSDYALDTHGDTRARQAYTSLALATLDALEILAEEAHGVIRVLRNGEQGRPRTSRQIGVEDLAIAIEAQARRIARGEYAPIPREQQPDAEQATAAVERLVQERNRLKTENERLKARQPRRRSRGWSRS